MHSLSKAAFGLLAAIGVSGVYASPTHTKSNSAHPTHTLGPVVKLDTFTGPLLKYSLGNPSVIESDGTYYVYATHNGQNTSHFKNVPMAMSTSLTSGWEEGGDALSNGVGKWTLDPAGPGSEVWTPDVSLLSDGRFIMYYSAKSATAKNNERCIGIAYSSTPTGPFNPNDTPWYCPPSGGAIGVDGIQDGDQRYVLFKNESHKYTPSGGSLSHIALWEVEASDGATKIGQPYQLTNEEAHHYGWEGPALTKMPDGSWLLLHTTGSDKSSYQIHYAVSKNITHVYKERGVLVSNPAHSSDGSVIYIPGGPDFIGQSNTQFMFFGSPTSADNAHNLYYGELEYPRDGSVRMKFL